MNVGKMSEDTLKKLEEQKAFEDETAKRLTPLYNSTKNIILRMFIHRIILDTMKHSDMYQTLVDINTGAEVSYVEKERMTEELTRHVEEEAKMLNGAIELREKVEDENTRRLIEHIIEDEKRHHQILEELLGIIKKIYEMRRDEWSRRLYEMIKPDLVS